MRVLSTSYLFVAELLLGVSAANLEFWHTVDYIDRESKAVDFVLNGQFHWSIDIAAFLVSANVQVLMVCPVISEFVN